MARRIRQPYRSPAVGQLARQLFFAPPEKRAEQVLRAERLHDQVELAIDYPFEFVSYRITGYRSESKETPVIPGGDLLHDLRLLIDALCLSAFVPPPVGDPLETPDELARRLGVSVKTVQRWRRDGLRWRWVRAGKSNVKRMVVARSAITQFLTDHPQRLTSAQKFSSLSVAERDRLIARARKLASRSDASFNRIATHLARRGGRGVETVRQLLVRHDRDHPHSAVFPRRGGPLTTRQRRVIARAHRMGVSVAKICRHFGRTRITIYRTIHQQRLADLRRLRIEFVHLPIFDRADAREVILAPDPAEGTTPRPPKLSQATVRTIAELPEPLRPWFLGPALGEPTQRALLVRCHFLRFLAARTRDAIPRDNPRIGQITEVTSLLAEADKIRRRLRHANLRLVLSTARRHLMDEPDPPQHRELELIEQGIAAVDAAIDSFDTSLDHTIEAILTRALMRRFAGRESAAGRAHRRPDAGVITARILALIEGA